MLRVVPDTCPRRMLACFDCLFLAGQGAVTVFISSAP